MMKKSLFVLFLLATFVSPVYSQIQNKFFGCRFGSDMSCLLEVLENKNNMIGENNLIVTNIRFGGFIWDFAEFRYIENQLFGVSFNIKDKNKHKIVERFSILKDKLDNKYYNYSMLNVSDEQTQYYEDNENVCSLKYEYGEAANGGKYWFVRLYYWNNRLAKIALNKDDAEL